MKRYIALLVADGFEDLELHYSLYRLIEEGYSVDVIGIKKGLCKGKHSYSVEADYGIGESEPKNYDGVVIPGGHSPSILRKEKKVLDFVHSMYYRKRLVAAICHGPQVLVSAGIAKGSKLTCAPQIKDEVLDMGGVYEDMPVVVDRNMVTSRFPPDLPFFMKEVISFLR